MNFVDILNNFNPIGLNNIVFYPLSIIAVSYTIAFLLSRHHPNNRNIMILISIPILVSIINILINSYDQVCAIITDYNRFKLFAMSNFLLLVGGVFHNFQVKYMFVSHLISSTLHIYFYLYSQHNEAAGIIATLFTPTLSYFALLGFVYFTFSHFILKRIDFNLIGNRIDRILLVNESNSGKIIVLLQSYIMIIHTNFVYFIDKWFDYSALSFSVVFAIIVLQFFLIALSLRILSKYPSSASAPFYVSANFMIVKILVDQILENYKIYKNSETFSLQLRHFSNKFMFLSLCLFVVCVLNIDVAYASDGEVASATVEGASAGRYARTGGTFAGGAISYEMVSMSKEGWENLGESSEQGAILNEKVQNCIAAKDTLNTIDYKLKSEFELIQEADIYLRMVEQNTANADVEDLRKYTETVERYTTKLQANYNAYEEYKSNITHKVYRWFCGVNSCSCGSRAKES